MQSEVICNSKRVRIHSYDWCGLWQSLGTARKTITLTDKQDDWIKAQVEAGHFTNDSEYIRDLIRREQERSAEIVAAPAAPRLFHQQAQFLDAQVTFFVHAHQYHRANGKPAMANLADNRSRHAQRAGQCGIVLVASYRAGHPTVCPDRNRYC